MKKLFSLILVLLLLLTGCGGKTPVSGQVLEVWEDQLLLAPDGGGRLTLSLPEGMEEPQTGLRIRCICREDRLLSYEYLEGTVPPPTELGADLPQLNP